MISPLVLSTLQQDIVNKFTSDFAVISGYAAELFYLLAVIELVLFGLMWAFKQEAALGALLFKIIKLGVIFLIISSYPILLQSLMNGFTLTAFHSASDKTAIVFFDPGKIWQFGFDKGVAMLQLAVEYGTANVGLSNLYLITGFGTLLLFALIGAEILVLTAAFYIVSLLALLLIPFGALSVTKNLFERAIYGVMSVGAMVFALVLVLSIGVTVWSQFGNDTLSSSTKLSELLGIFFSTLVIWVLCVKVPKLAAKAIGQVGGNIFAEFDTTRGSTVVQAHVQAPAQSSGTQQVAAGSVVSPQSVASATTMASGSPVTQTGTASTISGSTTTTSAAAVNVTATAAGGGSILGSGASSGKLEAGAQVERGFTRDELNKLKTVIKEAMSQPDDSHSSADHKGA